MSLRVEKGIRGGTCHGVHQYLNSNRKYMKDYDKNHNKRELKQIAINHSFRY